MPIYLWEGLPLLNAGRIAVAEACCCDGSGGDGCPPCCDCPVLEFTVAGLTGGGDCANINGDYTLNLFGACDIWNGGNGTVTAAMIKVDGGECGIYRLTIGPVVTGASEADYEIDILDWVCDGCNTLTLTNITGTCSGWPETLEVCCAA